MYALCARPVIFQSSAMTRLAFIFCKSRWSAVPWKKPDLPPPSFPVLFLCPFPGPSPFPCPPPASLCCFAACDSACFKHHEQSLYTCFLFCDGFPSLCSRGQWHLQISKERPPTSWRVRPVRAPCDFPEFCNDQAGIHYLYESVECRPVENTGSASSLSLISKTG